MFKTTKYWGNTYVMYLQMSCTFIIFRVNESYIIHLHLIQCIWKSFPLHLYTIIRLFKSNITATNRAIYSHGFIHSFGLFLYILDSSTHLVYFCTVMDSSTHFVYFCTVMDSSTHLVYFCSHGFIHSFRLSLHCHRFIHSFGLFF